MRRHLTLLASYFAQFVKTRLAYRADFFVDSAAVVAALAVHLTFLGIIYTKIQSLVGWSFPQLIFIHGFSLVPLGLFNLVSRNLWNFSDNYIVEGHFDRVLLRPVNPLFQILFESFNISSLNEMILGIVLMVTAGARLGLEIGPLDVVLFPVLAVSAAAIYAGVFIILMSVSFWFEDRLGIAPPVYNMIRFARYPVTIFHPAVRALLSWVVPFAFAAFYPATHFLRTNEFRVFAALTPVMAVAVVGVGVLFFHRGTRRYRSTGS
jgi:ABC-2 type transport system permease protein